MALRGTVKPLSPGMGRSPGKSNARGQRPRATVSQSFNPYREQLVVCSPGSIGISVLRITRMCSCAHFHRAILELITMSILKQILFASVKSFQFSQGKLKKSKLVSLSILYLYFLLKGGDIIRGTTELIIVGHFRMSVCS